MAYDYEKVKAWYEALSPEKQKQFDQMNRNDANYQSFITRYNQEKASANSTPTSSNRASYQNQGTWNYVYNEKTWYYENQTDNTNNTVNQDFNKTTEVIKQETPTKQQETVVKTDNEVKQEWQLKPLSQDYYNQTSSEAQDKIINNLNWYRQTNPELFSNYEAFKKNFSYDARNEEQKQTLDTWYKWYEKSMQLSAIPTTDLYTQYKDGQVSLSDLESLRISNPTKYAELQEQINKWNIISAYDDDKGTGTTWMNIQEMAYNAAVQMFTKFMSGDTSSGASQIFREYEQKMDDPEMLALSDNCTEIDEQRENIQADIDSMKKQVEAEYEWTWASRAKINAIIADRTYDLQLQLRTLNSEYNKYATQYNNRMQQYQTEFNMQLQEYQINQNERQTQMKELGFALDLMNFETNDQKQEREWNYWVKQQEYQNWNINSKDYQTRYKAALTSVQNLLSQYEGIPMQRSAEQMAQDILTAIDWGSDLGTELTKINKQIQQKPEYKYLYNNTYWKSNDVKYDTFKLWDQEYILYNNELMSAEEFNKKYWNKAEWSTWDAKPYDIVSSDKFTIKDANWYTVSWTLGSFLASTPNQEWKTWGWCGAYVNKYLKSIWVWSNYYDDELSTKVNSVNSQVPKVWSIAVYDYWHITKETGKNHGHVGIVVAVHEDGTYDVMDSNYGSDKKIQLRQNLNPQSSNCKWFFDPSQPPAWSSSSSSNENTLNITRNYEPTRVWLYDKYINDWAAPTDAKLKALWGGDLDKWWQIFDAEVADYMAKTWAWSLEKRATDEITKLRTQFNQEQTVKDYKDMLTNYSKIEISAKKGTPQGDMSLIFAYMKMLDPGSVVREWEYATAQNAGNVWDKIINLYNKAVTWNKLTQSQRDEFLNTAKSLMDGMTVNYNNILDDYSSYITRWGDSNKIGKRGTFITDEYIKKYWWTTPQSTTQTTYQSTNTWNPSWVNQRTPWGSSSSSYSSNNYVNIEWYEFDISWF